MQATVEVFFLFKLRWNSHKIQLTVLKCSIQWHLGYSQCVPLPSLFSFKTLSLQNTSYSLSNHTPFPIFPQPEKPPACSPFLWIYLTWNFPWMAFHDWLLTLSVMFSRLIQVEACISIFFFFLPNNLCTTFATFFHCTACGILVPQSGTESEPSAVKNGILTTGPPGKSLFLQLLCESRISSK